MIAHTISIHQLFKKFPHTAQSIFSDLSYQFVSDKSYALMGPSGVGKSTLMAMIAGIDHVSSGTIYFDDHVISSQSFQSRVAFLQDQMGIIFQQPCLIAELTVLENVMLKSIIQENVTQELKLHALKLLSDVGLEGKALCFAHTLSGGQQQKVAILRAIFHAPKFLLADEPTGNLDRASAQQIIELLLFYQKKYNMGLIVSTHDMLVAQQCDLIVTIVDQKLTML